jgi:diguanylate cyclase (GGDEF)-like protein
MRPPHPVTLAAPAPPRDSTHVRTSEWGALVDVASEHLGRVRLAPPGSESAQPALAACALALSQLQQALPEVLERCLQLEARACTAEAALQQASAELQDSQDGARRAEHLALHDALTRLPNRRYFVQRLRAELAHLPASEPTLALLYLDLDGFKAINDAHGHAFGDELLHIVAARLQRCVRSTDMVSRLGGDEFACLRMGRPDRQALVALADKLYRAVAAPLRIGPRTLQVRPSIGLALCPQDARDAEPLMHCADLAMYRAKQQRSRHAFFDEVPAGRAPGPDAPARS